MSKMSTSTKTQFLAGTLSNAKRLFAPLDPVETGPYVRSMRTTALGFAIARPDLPDLCANDRFALQIRADMEVHVLVVIPAPDFCAYVPLVVEGLFAKRVRYSFVAVIFLICFFMYFMYLVGSEDTKSK